MHMTTLNRVIPLGFSCWAFTACRRLRGPLVCSTSIRLPEWYGWPADGYLGVASQKVNYRMVRLTVVIVPVRKPESVRWYLQKGFALESKTWQLAMPILVINRTDMEHYMLGNLGNDYEVSQKHLNSIVIVTFSCELWTAKHLWLRSWYVLYTNCPIGTDYLRIKGWWVRWRSSELSSDWISSLDLCRDLSLGQATTNSGVDGWRGGACGQCHTTADCMTNVWRKRFDWCRSETGAEDRIV